jgi:hypothetical protein
VALATPLLRDGNGTDVRLGPQPFVAVRAAPSRLVRGPVRLVLVARAGGGAVRLRAPGARWNGGAAWTADVSAGAEVRPAPWLAARALAGISWLRGPRDVEPFATLGALRPAAEAGVTLRRPGGGVGIELAAQGFRVSPSGGDAGGVGRYMLGVSYAP